MVDTNNITGQHALEHALQATALKSLSVKPLELLNEAGEFLTSMHSWGWLTTDHAWLKSRGNITLTDGNWTEATKRLTSDAGTPFADYVFVPGDYLRVTGGTGVIEKRIGVTSAGSSSQIVIDESLSSAGIDLANADIAATLHTNLVDLPADFGSIVSVEGANTLTYGLQLTSPADIQRLRTNQIDVTSTWDFRCAVVWTGSPSRPVLDVYPDRTTDTEDHFSIVYKRGWSRLSQTSDTLVLPDFCTALYYQIVRAFALGYERGEDADVDDRLAKVMVGPVFQSAKNRDHRVQPTMGRMRGGAVQRTSQPKYRNALSTEVGGPS